MDLDETQLTAVLQDAFACYLSFLSHQQRIREDKLPRQGKGVETTADVTTQDQYHSRVAGVETCIQCCDRLARRVLRWSEDPDDRMRDHTVVIEPNAERYEAFLEEEVPFLDPFDGSWIIPVTRNSAGPSGRDDGVSEHCVDDPMSVQTKIFPMPRHLDQVQAKSPEMKQVQPISGSTIRPAISLHPNVPLSFSTISLPKRSSRKLSHHQVSSLKTPNYYSTSEEEEEDEKETESESEEEILENKVEDSKPVVEDKNQDRSEEESTEEGSSEDDNSDNSSDKDEDDETNTGITSEMTSHHSHLNATKPMAPTTSSPKHAFSERTRKASLLRSEQMAATLALEEQARLDAQEAFARRLQREEQAREDTVRRNREAAQREQVRWEAAARALATETKRKAEKKIREANEKRALAEEGRVSREREEEREKARLAERERERDRGDRGEGRHRHSSSTRHRDSERRHSVARRASSPRRNEPPPAPVKKTRFSDREPSKRRSSTSAVSRPEPPKKPEAPKRSESTRKVENVEPARKISPPRKPEPSKKVNSPKKIDCVSCMEPGSKRDMSVLECKHAYCTECINEAFKSALKSHTLFKCCAKSPTVNTLPHLSSSLSKKYALLTLELSTPSPKYCSSKTCSAFLPPSSIHGPLGICTSCKTRTCIPCGKTEHSGVCKNDREGKKLVDLAKKQGWKQCPNCSQILERTFGCLHMTCRCGANWCYSCLRDWEICGSSCSRDDPDNGYRAAPPPPNHIPPPPPPPGRPAPANPWGRHADLAALANNNRNPFQAALAERIGNNVRVQHDRNTGQTRMRAEAAGGAGGGVFPVIATAVLMALMRGSD